MANHPKQLNLLDGQPNNTVQGVLEQRRDTFTEKRERRIDRYEGLAQSHAAESDRRWKAGSQMFDAIPLGQPILKGHHSERADRRYRKRAGDNLDKSIEHSKAAQHYAERAAAAKNNTSISSDDPDALEKLEEKLKGMEERQEFMKRVNKCIRSKKLKRLPAEDQAAYLAKETDIGIEAATSALKPDFCGRVGFPTYALQNNNGNMRRVRQRIAAVKMQHEDIAEHGESREERYDDLELTVIFNYIDNRLQLDFDAARIERPVYNLLTRQYAFKKTREGIYQRQLNQWSESFANTVVNAIREL